MSSLVRAHVLRSSTVAGDISLELDGLIDNFQYVFRRLGCVQPPRAETTGASSSPAGHFPARAGSSVWRLAPDPLLAEVETDVWTLREYEQPIASRRADVDALRWNLRETAGQAHGGPWTPEELGA